MEQQPRRRNTRALWGLVLLAVAYGVLLQLRPALTGATLLDGAIGVILGLYICSHPAANAINLLFAQRGGLRPVSSEWTAWGWLAFNLLVMLVGWLVIVSGTTRLVE